MNATISTSRLKNILTGKNFGYWKVLEYAGKEMWKCECKCGCVKNILSSSLIRHRSKSCGCHKSPANDDYDERTKERLKKYIVLNEIGCWIWSAYKDDKGYGYTTYRKKTGVKSSRLSWIIYKGEIPKGMYVLHKCDNPSCINPDHLFLGTHQDNMKDMKEKGRACKGEKSHLHKKNRRTTYESTNNYKK